VRRPWHAPFMGLLLALFGCQPEGYATVPDGTGPTGVEHSGLDSHSDGSEPVPHTGDTASSGHTAAPIDPCDELSPVVLGFRRVSDVRPSEEFAFDAQGYVWNATEGSGLFRTDFTGTREVVSPGGALEYAGIGIQPDGLGLALADESGGVVLSIDLATGSRDDLFTVAGPNSMAWDDHGRLWVGANQRLVRFDPVVGGAPEVITNVPGADLDGVTFSPDGRTLYFNDDTGHEVGKVELDAEGEVLSISSYADLGGGIFAAELDGMTTDICGNLYVTHTDGRLTRVLVDGTQQILVASSGHWTTAAHFGSGVGGWFRDRLYVMDRQEGLWELDVGIEGHPEPHLP
jgi:hypothetical protein